MGYMIYDGLPAVFLFRRFRSLLNVTIIGDVSNNRRYDVGNHPYFHS